MPLHFAPMSAAEAWMLGYWPGLQEDVVARNDGSTAIPIEGPPLIEGLDAGSAQFDGTAGSEVASLPLYEQFPDQMFALYSMPLAVPPAGRNAIIACKDDGARKPAGGWSLEDFERDGEIWARLYWRLANGAALWIGPKEGAFLRKVGRPDLLAWRRTTGEVSFWANREKITAQPVDSSPEQNTAPLRFAMYAPGIALWNGMAQGAGLWGGVLRDDDMARMPLPRPAPIPIPKPPQFICLDKPGPLDTGYAGKILDSGTILNLDRGKNTRYDLRDTLKAVALVGGETWAASSRALARIDGNRHANADHDGICIIGGAWICTNMTPDGPDWGPTYQSKTQPREVLSFRKANVRNITIEGTRIDGGWDGVALQIEDGYERGHAHLFRIAMTGMRDDCLESDTRYPDVIVDECCWEGMVMYSSSNKSAFDGSKQRDKVQHSIFRLIPVRLYGTVCTNQFFKVDARAPLIDSINNVYVAEQEFHLGGGDLFYDLKKSKKIGEWADNIFCWFGNGPYRHDVPPGVRVLYGNEAETALADALVPWWQKFPGYRFPGDPKA